IETCTNRISLLEKQGDTIVQSLEEMFGKGSISAILMREFERLADSVDSVLDRAHALSRQIRRVTKRPLREAKEFDAIIRKDQVRLIEIGLVQLQGLRKLFSVAGSDMKQSLVLAGLLGAVVSGNNLSACCGTIIGSGMVNRRSGIMIAVAGYLLGLSIEGPKLFKVREAFLPTETSTEIFLILLAALLIFVG